MRIERAFFERDTLTVAENLLGQVLVRESAEGVTKGVIVETEAYLGSRDDAAHSYKGKTERVKVLYGSKGCAYVYMIYGMYYCLNFSTGPKGVPECVLVRALEPIEGIELMASRRGTEKLRMLCSGPGKLCMAMGISKELYGVDLCADKSGFYLEYGEPPAEIVRTPRIGIDYAEKCRDELWRFAVKDNPFLSQKQMKQAEIIRKRRR